MGQRFEQFNARLNDFIKPMRFLMMASITVLVCATVWYGIPVLKGWSHALEAQARQSEDATGKIAMVATRFDNIAAKIEKRIDPILDNAEGATVSFRNAAASVDRQLPVILSNLAATGSQTNDLVKDIRLTTLPAVNASLLKLGRTIEVTGEELPKVVAELAKTGEDVRLILEQPALRGPDSILDSLNRTAHSAEVIPVDLHAIGVQAERATKSVADGANDVQMYVHQTLFPPPCVGKGCFVKKWILQPLKAGSGLLYLILKAQSGQL